MLATAFQEMSSFTSAKSCRKRWANSENLVATLNLSDSENIEINSNSTRTLENLKNELLNDDKIIRLETKLKAAMMKVGILKK